MVYKRRERERQSKGREVTRSRVCPPRVGEARRFSCVRRQKIEKKEKKNGYSTSAKKSDASKECPRKNEREESELAIEEERKRREGRKKRGKTEEEASIK